MRYKTLFLSFIFFSLSINLSLAYAEEAYIETFSPQGTVKDVRQVTVRFSEQMVPFGDPRLLEPFDIRCPEKGQARWADGKNWIYDFERDLPAGIACEFILKPNLKTLSEKGIGGHQRFSFSTGGPAIRQSYPHEGSTHIDENQIFILTLDSEATEESILSNVSCSIEGINERVGVSILKDKVREGILKVSRYRDDKLPRVVLQCRQSFPNNSKVSLIWGKGVSSLSGVKTTEDQILPLEVRGPFTATFSCERENPKADCIPILPMRIKFSSPVSWNIAKNILLKSIDKVYRVYRPSKGSDEEEGEEVSDGNFIYHILFKGPFPENTSFSIEIPKNMQDDAERELANKDNFPLKVRTDSYPPLAKFSARFGIIELKGDAVLPVTLRNLEPEVKTRMLKVDKKKEGVVDKAKEGLLEKTVKAGEAFTSILPDSTKEKGKDVVEGLKGRLHRVQMGKEERIIEWLKKVASAERENTILKNESDIKEFFIPKPGGSKAFEVIGIPLKKPGFYVVELESEILGASLLGEQKPLSRFGRQKPLYVPTASIVTNLSAHFKWGRESSLVWVTTLDKAETVKDASVSIRDCNGKVIWEGKTDEKGVARIKTSLPSEQKLPRCSLNINYGEASHSLNGIGRGLFVFAKTADDMTFVHSTWDNGIEPWRYNLPEASYQGPVIAHTIMDRSLLRAGETVHMKHIIRKHTMSGFSVIKESELPKAVLIHHTGSKQRYEFPLKWDQNGISETTWKIPPDAKLGNYEIVLLKKATEKPKERTAIGGYERGDEEYFYPDGWPSGSFRVEEYRVPLMKAIIQPPKEPLVNAPEVNIDLLVTYLSGGGASNLPVKLRSQILPKYLRFDDYEDFVFSNGEVKEGITRRSDYEEGEEESARERPKTKTADLVLDKSGSLRTKIIDLSSINSPQDILTELEFRDPNGEVQTVSQKIPLWPSRLLIGIKPDSWAASKESFKFHVIALDLKRKPVSEKEIKVELFQRRYYSHRKRLVGGFYSYEHVTEVKRIGHLCERKTDQKGLLICEVISPVSGNVILQARTMDDKGNPSIANRDVWIAGKGEWWFNVSDSDRIDLLPEKKRYEPGETAKFQVRMPFREATALITVEREGIIDTFIERLLGKTPVIEIPVKKNYAPNIFVSALVVRGRVGDIQPTALEASRCNDGKKGL